MLPPSVSLFVYDSLWILAYAAYSFHHVQFNRYPEHTMGVCPVYLVSMRCAVSVVVPTPHHSRSLSTVAASTNVPVV